MKAAHENPKGIHMLTCLNRRYTRRVAAWGLLIWAALSGPTFVYAATPEVNLSASPGLLYEGDPTLGSSTITATLSEIATNTVSVDLAFSGTATKDSDYTASTTTLIIPQGSLTATAQITTVSDGAVEPQESITIGIGGVTNAVAGAASSVTLAIEDPPVATLEFTDTTFSENRGSVTANINLSKSYPLPLNVTLVFSGTASKGTDYLVNGSTSNDNTLLLQIPSRTTRAQVSLTGVPDAITEGDETVTLDLATPATVNIGTPSQATVMLTDAALPDNPQVQLTLSKDSFDEHNGTLNVVATLSASAFNPVSIGLQFSGTAELNKDYTASSSTIIIPVGASTGSATLTGITDDLVEGDETVLIDVDPGAIINATLSSAQDTLTATLLDGTVAGYDLSLVFPEKGGDGSDGFVVNGINANDNAGTSASVVGDINGDGIPDLAVGDPYRDRGSSNNQGEVFLIYGGSNFPARIYASTLNGTNGVAFAGVATDDRTGESVRPAGDVNGDGIDDLIIGAPGSDAGATDGGAAYIVFGRNAAIQGSFPSVVQLSGLDGSNGFVLHGMLAQGNLGAAVAGVGDINNDGIDDILVGAPGEGNGTAYVVYGRDPVTDAPFDAALDTEQLMGDIGFKLTGDASASELGRAVSAAGDVNGDGIADMIIAAHLSRTYVLFGRDWLSVGDFPDAVDLSTFSGVTGFALNLGEGQLFKGVAAAGDVNGDGFDDIVIGIPATSASATPWAGLAHVIYGRAASTNPFPALLSLSSLASKDGFTVEGIDDQDRLGFAVAGNADVTGDGIADLLIGAVGADVNGNASGESYLLPGRDAATDGAFPAKLSINDLEDYGGFSLRGVEANDQSGYAVSLGDLDGDSLADMVVGAPFADAGGGGAINAGETYAVLSGPLFGNQPGPGPDPGPGPGPSPSPLACDATYDAKSGLLTLPQVAYVNTISSGVFSMVLIQIDGPYFSRVESDTTTLDSRCEPAEYEPLTGELKIPDVKTVKGDFRATLTRIGTDLYQLVSYSKN